MAVHDLIYDVGMHKGEDTDFYLKKGFRVVAFEADPDLIEACKRRFHDEISSGRLRIVEGAIVEPKGDKKIRFYKNTKYSYWNTAVDDWVARNEKSSSHSTIIEVDAIDFSACLEQYGIPHYMKVDIEGMDLVCFKALRGFSERPHFVSLESEKVNFRKLEDDVKILTELGYAAFKAVQQDGIADQKEPVDTVEGRYANFNFSNGSSGLFGRDLPNKWFNHEEIINEYKRIFLKYRYFGDFSIIRRIPLSSRILRTLGNIIGTPLPGWHDIHAVHKDFEFQ